ncbi:hypothetical protein Vadar_001640 [Vaccinium darrowii]|uniref:Uncharacterized protein n=1 Tax=Vaccinium darrowii TaxID=229202 RepID=A0ACB7WWT2_9ERIC|nr:hypothetical protein Vadar_001640 [Vaccinium darrowii]
MCNLDLRFVVPALVNLTLSFLQHHQPILDINLDNWFFSIVIILTLIVFLFTSVKLPLSVITHPIRVRAGDFSSLLVISLLGSIFLPQPIFWFGYVITICVSPWHGFLSAFLFRFWNILRAIPVLMITCIVHNHEQHERETDTPPPPQVVVLGDDDDDDDIRGNPRLLEQQSSEPHTTVVVVQP